MTSFDPTSPRQASEMLRAHGIRPLKRLGQNFLCDRNTLDRIVRAAEITPEEPTLEIGAGLGALTLALSNSARAVTAVEIDRHMEPVLAEVLGERTNVRLVFEDILRLDLPALLESAFDGERGTVVANIPYYISTPILQMLLEHKEKIRRIVILVQTEFASRMVAPPNSEECGALSLFAQYHAHVELVGIVPRTVFLPSPEVSSAIVALTPVLPGTVAVTDESRMFYLIRAAFGQRRKTLLNALLRAPASFGLGFTLDNRSAAEALLERAGIDGNRRGETLSLTEFARLAEASLLP